MAELEAAPLPEGNGLGPQGAVAATKIDAGSFDLPRNHDDFDDGDDDDFGHFATAAAAPPVPAADVNHIPAADDAVTSEVAVTCDSTNGTLLPSLCLGDSDDDSATSQDTSGLVRQASAELPFSGETGGVKREDSFDDFQQAQAVAPPFEAALAPVDEGSDFADFEQACDTVVADSCEWGDSKGDGFADFAAFGDASKTAVEDGDWADDDWKSFANAEDGEATSVVSPVALPQQGTVSGQLVPGEGSFENLFQSAYTLEGASLSPVSAEDEDFVALSCCEVHVRLWEQLEDLDRAPSLKFSWNGSHSCQHLLQSLSIDSRNIQAGADSAIPPAQFDWTSSGLVNPLEQPAASTLLDLEFLSSLSSATVGSSPPTSSLEKEFLELSGSAAAPVSSQSSAPSKLQELLRNNVSTLSSTRRRPSLLSGEAQAILDRLPDLSFMQARVLMFPVHLD
ncbi:uncharacterized protein LOC119458261 isoform X3 [Dermacentor silvarum]|uniref:uncharacterized protein LOC119458261 isoform X3 n=1 Tax=Dermacentor silvarum TaxID=543639 RepID=UPI0021011F75|nr:uncharacterized protein LOC119458261 isoform X3 [Dermacentor silvarum]